MYSLNFAFIAFLIYIFIFLLIHMCFNFIMKSPFSTVFRTYIYIENSLHRSKTTSWLNDIVEHMGKYGFYIATGVRINGYYP